jgi:hypothetical protein
MSKNIVSILKKASTSFIERLKGIFIPSVPKISVQGNFAGHTVETTVDSKLAKYYLENYLSGKKTQPKLDQLINQVEAELLGPFPSRESLKKLANKISVDFATLYLTKRILETPTNQKFQSIFLDAYQKTREAAHPEDLSGNTNLSSFIILIAPAWDYVEMGPTIGTDFADIRKLMDQMDLENHLLQIDPIGSVEKNAEIVAKEIVNFSSSSKKAIILVSGSSSSPSVAHALGEILNTEQLDCVKGWFNAVGILQGASFIDFFMRRPIRWGFHAFLKFKKWDIANVESMSTRIRRDRFQKVQIPENIFILNYLSIPLSGNISQFARLSYKIIRKQGPNDGSALIVDTIAPNGISIVSFGTDHFINFDPNLPFKAVAIVQTMANHIIENYDEI